MSMMIEVYVFICVMLLLFVMLFLGVKNRKRLRFEKGSVRFEKEVEQYFDIYQKGENIPEKVSYNLKKYMSKTKNLVALQNMLEKDTELKDSIRPYIMAQVEQYEKKSDYEQAFYTYMISTLEYKEKEIPKEFTERFILFLDTASLYTFVNTMKAFYQFGQAPLMMVAINKVDERIGFYHKKLFVDGLLTYQGDFIQLKELIIERFDEYKDETKENLIDFFRLKGLDVSTLCLKLLNDLDTPDEVRYAAMRYFCKVPSKEAKQIFLNILIDENSFWTDQMIAIQGLRDELNPSIKKIIMEKITDKNWYIRVNASEYLCKYHMNEEDIYSILKKKDQYANEILRYQYRDNSELSKYITDTIKQLEQQENNNYNKKSVGIAGGEKNAGLAI